MSCGTTSRLSWLSMQLGSTKEGMGNNKKFRLRVMKLLCISNGRGFADVPNRRQVGESEMQVTSDSESAMRKNGPSRLQSVSQSIYSILENLYLGHGGELSGSFFLVISTWNVEQEASAARFQGCRRIEKE